jgi:hypothetical protein
VAAWNEGLDCVDVGGVRDGEVRRWEGLGRLHFGLHGERLGVAGGCVCGQRGDEGCAGLRDGAGGGVGELGVLGHGLHGLAGLFGSEGVGEGCALGAHGVLVMLVSLVLLIYGIAEGRTYHLFV